MSNCFVDTEIFKLCKEKNIRYTRYADDLTFSSNIKDSLFLIPEIVESLINEIEYPNLEINTNKTVFLSKKVNRHVTGLVISNEGTVSIGRAKKRIIKSMVYKFINENLSNSEKLYLQGYLSFCEGVDKDFLAVLIRKYGIENIESIKNYNRN